MIKAVYEKINKLLDEQVKNKEILRLLKECSYCKIEGYNFTYSRFSLDLTDEDRAVLINLRKNKEKEIEEKLKELGYND